MDLYHVWFDAKEGVSDTELGDAMGRYFAHLKDQGRLAAWASPGASSASVPRPCPNGT